MTGHELPAPGYFEARLSDQAAQLPALLFDIHFHNLCFSLGGFFVKAVRLKLLPPGELSPRQLRQRKATLVRRLLVDLGPTFIKIGQFLSARRDILPEEIADELALLQDQVPPFDFQRVKATISCDLAQPLEKIFAYFEQAPVASASIGQVHRARLNNGAWVAVKVQRPGIAQRFLKDLGYLRLAIRLLSPFQALKARTDWLELSEEMGRSLFSELDYLQEGRNADRLRLALRQNSRVRIPRVYWRYTGRRVLALEYLNATKIDQISKLNELGVDRQDLSHLLIECYLQQILVGGFFHADPHAGNLALNESCDLVIYDFGMMGEITPRHRDLLAKCAIAITRRDAAGLAECLLELGVLKSKDILKPAASSLLPLLDYLSGVELTELNFQPCAKDLDLLLARGGIRLPTSLAYLFKTVLTLDGIVRMISEKPLGLAHRLLREKATVPWFAKG